MSKYSNLEKKSLKDLRDLAKGLKIVGRFQMDKEVLTTAINETRNEKSKTSKSEKNSSDYSIALAKEAVKESREKLNEARDNLLDQTTEAGIASAKNKVAAAENVLRMAKKQLKKVKKDSKEDRDFSWKAVLGWAALGLLTAAGGGLGGMVLAGRSGTEEVATNGDVI